MTVGYALIMTVIVVSFGGNILGLLLVFFVPGYVLVAALFPSDRKHEWVERIALSIGFSVVVIPLLGLAINFSPLGIRRVPFLGVIDVFTALVGLVAYWRRMRLAPQERLSASLDLAWPAWKDYSAIDKTLTALLLVGLVAAVGTVGFLTRPAQEDNRFTQFFLLGPGGNASGYPTVLNISKPTSVLVGIVNHEASTVNYTVRVELVGVRLVYDSTTARNETVEMNRTTWSWFNFTRADGQNWTQYYTFSIPQIGLWKVQFLLFVNGGFSVPYRELHLYLTIE